MKRLAGILMICLGIMVGNNDLVAQKIGYLNSTVILATMPEATQMQQVLDGMQKKFEKDLEMLYVEYEQKMKEFETKGESLPEVIKENKIKEILDLERAIQEYQVKAQDDLLKEQERLLEPMITKVNAAINKVAEANGYTYVFDSSTQVLVYGPEEHDLTEKVIEELK